MSIRPRLLIDLDLDAWPIGGRITSDENADRPFHGWLELTSAIEQRRTSAVTGRQATWRGGAMRGGAMRGAATAHGGAPSRSAPASRRARIWLSKRSQPRWMVLGAWACAGWSAVAVPALAATRSGALLACWALGLLAIVVLLVLAWTEQPTAADSHDGGPPPDEDPSGPRPPDERIDIDWSLRESEMLPRMRDGFDRGTAKRLLFLPALMVIAFFALAAPSALAATSLTGETLAGTGPSTGGSTSGSCPNRLSESGRVGFNVTSGTATGPYPGSFSESGTVSVSGLRNPPWRVTFSASFTIKSGGTTITGTFASPTAAYGSVGFICNSSGGVSGYNVTTRANYTAVFGGLTYQGTVGVSGTFYKTAGAKDNVSETVLVSYGQIAGAVADGASHAPLAGVCVNAYNASGSGVASTQTNASGAYTLANVPEGPTRVGFASGCGATDYLTQYYNGQSTLASANTVTVTAGVTTSGINAAMTPAGQITGTVTAAGTGIGGICVQAYDGTGAVSVSTQTAATGAYTLGPLPTGSYSVGFLDCNSYGYVAQYYNGKSTLAVADPVSVSDGTTTSGINAAMIAEGRISGTVTDKTTHAALAGFCVWVYDAGGNEVATATTDSNGAYTTSALPAGSYRLSFFSCGGSYTYPMQYYNGKATLSSADTVTVTNGATTTGINAALLTGGQITGTVTDSVTHAPVAGICALAIDANGNNVIEGSTDASGAYTIPDLETGSYRVEFYAQCGTMNYVTQYYNAKATLAAATSVPVALGSTISGINAAMVQGGEITGTATDSVTHAPIWGLCVDAFDSNGNDVAAGDTDRNGNYTIYGAPPGGARVEFYSTPSAYSDGSCGGTNYVTQYYDGKPTLATADPVTVAPGGATAAIDASMTAG